MSRVFDIKFDFTWKARYVAGGHKTEPPALQTYASIVSRESIHIAFLIAALNDVDLASADIAGAYLNAPCQERVHTICGDEFRPEYKGRVAVIVKALYGLRSAVHSWWEMLAGTLREALGFTPCLADPDVWIRAATKPDGTEYYEMVLVYTDDLLIVSHKAYEILM